MRFLFVIDTLKGIGGLETLMARMANWLCNHGHCVAMVIQEDGRSRLMFDKEVEFIVLGRDFYDITIRSKAYTRKIWKKHNGGSFDTIIACWPNSLCSGAAIANAIMEPCRLLAGVWTPRDYSIVTPRKIIAEPGKWIFHHLLDADSRLFADEEREKEIARGAGHFVPGKVWYLPVEGGRFEKARRRPNPGRIVSIGRLAVMKEYNLWMVPVIRSLVDEGFDVKWDVYGDGPMRPKMEQLIRLHRLEDRIHIHGLVDYVQLPSLLSDAWAFVGVGTALVEAGFARVPSIPAIQFLEEPLTYGYLHEVAGYGPSLMLDQPPMKSVLSLLKNLLTMNPEDYRKIEDSTFVYVSRFNLEHRMAEFEQYVLGMTAKRYTTFPRWLCRISYLMRTIWPAIRYFSILFRETRRF